MKNKSGELNLSFGMIFSIFLIIMFLAFGFYGIKEFLKFQAQTQISLFAEDLQNDVTELWQSGVETDWARDYTVSMEVTQVCFEKNTMGNLIINTKETAKLGTYDRKNIDYIDLTKMIGDQNRFCIDNVKGKINVLLSLGEGETLVTIKK